MPFTPTTSRLDNFQRADEAPLTGGWTTNARAVGNLQLRVLSNACQPSVSGFNTAAWSASPFGRDQEAWAKVGSASGANYQSIYLLLRGFPSPVAKNTGWIALGIEFRVSTNEFQPYYGYWSPATDLNASGSLSQFNAGAFLTRAVAAGDYILARVVQRQYQLWHYSSTLDDLKMVYNLPSNELYGANYEQVYHSAPEAPSTPMHIGLVMLATPTTSSVTVAEFGGGTIDQFSAEVTSGWQAMLREEPESSTKILPR